jgi:glycosyltransferase involved in cell wall biosynthesis
MNWIVSELFYPDEVSTAQILTDIALKKIETSELSVICGPSGYEKTYDTKRIYIDCRIKIFRVGVPSLNKNKIFQRILRFLILTIKMSWLVLIKVKKGDKVFLTTNPTFLILTISILKSFKSFNLEILVHDVFPENLVPAGLINKDSKKYKILSKIYNKSYKKADRIIVLGEDMKELLKNKITPENIIIDVVPNWCDSDIYPLKEFNMSRYLGVNVEDKIVLGFAGNIGRVQGIEEFINLFKKSENSDLVFVIIGDGSLGKVVSSKIRNESLQNIYYLGPRSRSEQNLFLNSCHIGLVSLINGMKGLGVPSKTYNLMAAGKPIFYVGDPNSEIDNYVINYNCGWSFDWKNEGAIINMMNSFSINDLSYISEKGVNALLASKNYEKNKVLNLF